MTVAEKTPARSTPPAKLVKLVRLRAQALTNGWDLAPLLKEAAGLDDRELARTLMVLKSGLVAVDAKRTSMRVLLSRVPWKGSHEFRGIPMWAWRTILETEASLRDGFPAVLTLTSAEPSCATGAPSSPWTGPETPETPAGRLASEVTSAREIRKIWRSCRKNGGKLSFEEAEHKHGLRKMKGMTAWRVCKKHENRRRKKR